MSENVTDKPIEIDAGEYSRIRQMALQRIRDHSRNWGGELDAEVFALGGGWADDAWKNFEQVTDAVTGAWYYWRDPSEPGDIHVDQAIVDGNGKIEGKYGCGLSFYTDCQPCVFADDVKALLIEKGLWIEG